MSESTTKTSRVLLVLVALLVVAVAVQSYAMFRLHQKLTTALEPRTAAAAQQSPSQPADKPNAGTKGAIAKKPSPSGRSPSIFPDDDWPLIPFNPDKWNPFDEMRRMREEIDRMFRDAFGRFQASPRFGDLFQDFSFSPNMDLREEKDRYIVRFDLPGMDKAKIDVKLEDRTLTVSGAREEKIEKREGGKILRRERRMGRFERSITLPGPVKAEGMKAEYKNGVLIVTIPKARKSSVSKRIKVL